jgi:hypothetical protein
MNRLFDKKPRKSIQSSQRHVALGIPTNIAVGPLGFRAELDIGPKGKQSRSYRDLEADRPDSTVTLDEESPRVSRIVFHDKRGKDQELPALETSTPGEYRSRKVSGLMRPMELIFDYSTGYQPRRGFPDRTSGQEGR